MIAEGASSAPRLARSSAVSFPGINECPGTHCSLIEQGREKTVPARSATEFEIRGNMEERTGWRGQNESQIIGEEKWQTCWCCRDQQRTCRMEQASAEKLEHTGPAEKERVASVPQRKSSWQERRSCPCQNKKKQSRLSRVPDHKEGESQDGREPHLGEREGDQSGSMEWKGWTPP